MRIPRLFLVGTGGDVRTGYCRTYYLRSLCTSRNVDGMDFDLKEIIAARLGENYQLHERHLNSTLVQAQRVIGFDKVYARAEGAYLYDMDNQPYLDFLSGYSVFNIGRNHPIVKQAIRDVLDLDLPNMVQMDCSLLS